MPKLRRINFLLSKWENKKIVYSSPLVGEGRERGK